MMFFATMAPPVLASSGPAPASMASVLEWNARLRQESVDDDAFAESANALTLRLRLGIRASLGSGWHGLLEAEAVAAPLTDYNSGANGKAGLPAVIDPSGAEINQAWIGWRSAAGMLTMGRQRLQFDNQRWVGNSGWRQNEQTFDGIAAEWRPTSPVLLRYAWLDRVHRVNSDEAIDPLARERRLATHVVDIAYTRGENQWGAYWIAHQDRDIESASSRSLGLRWVRTHVKGASSWGWRAETARQVDYAGNPLSFSHGYWLVEPWIKWRGVTWRAGREHLGGNGTHSLQTPLASLHAFNGWADKFLATPPSGLDDRYLGAGGTVGRKKWSAKTSWLVVYHDYRGDTGNDELGSELDASLGFPFSKSLAGLVKVADYRSGAWSRDTRKIWFQLEWTPAPQSR